MSPSSEYLHEQLNELQHENERLEDALGDAQCRIKELEGDLLITIALFVEQTKERNKYRDMLLRMGVEL